MNINSFNELFVLMEQEIPFIKQKFFLTDLCLKTQHCLSDIAKTTFSYALDDISNFANQKIENSEEVSILFTAKHAIQLTDCYDEIKKIRNNILKFAKEDRFVNEINCNILPCLIYRITDLREIIDSSMRLPFKEGNNRKNFYSKVNFKLQQKSLINIKFNTSQYLHLLVDHLNSKELKNLDITPYMGSCEIYGLKSWNKILTLFIKNGDVSEKEIGKFLQSIIQQAIPFALKTTFAFSIPQIYQSNDQFETDYLRDLVGALPSSTANQVYPREFLEKYTLRLGKSCLIPESVIINELTWDMLNAIHQMDEGEFRIFELGTRKHRLIIQVECIQQALPFDQGSYKYKIFNTGRGVLEYHFLDNQVAYPLIFRNLPLEAFSYSFLSKLIRLSLERDDIEAFYALHDKVLVAKFQGIKEYKNGNAYSIQKHGICAYAAVEAWIGSFLNPGQKKYLEILKAEFSIKKQEKFVDILQEKLTKKESTRDDESNPCNEVLTKKTKLNQTLLKLGRKYFRQANQEYRANFYKPLNKTKAKWIEKMNKKNQALLSDVDPLSP